MVNECFADKLSQVLVTGIEAILLLASCSVVGFCCYHFCCRYSSHVDIRKRFRWLGSTTLILYQLSSGSLLAASLYISDCSLYKNSFSRNDSDEVFLLPNNPLDICICLSLTFYALAFIFSYVLYAMRVVESFRDTFYQLTPRTRLFLYSIALLQLLLVIAAWFTVTYHLKISLLFVCATITVRVGSEGLLLATFLAKMRQVSRRVIDTPVHEPGASCSRLKFDLNALRSGSVTDIPSCPPAAGPLPYDSESARTSVTIIGLETLKSCGKASLSVQSIISNHSLHSTHSMQSMHSTHSSPRGRDQTTASTASTAHNANCSHNSNIAQSTDSTRDTKRASDTSNLKRNSEVFYPNLSFYRTMRQLATMREEPSQTVKSASCIESETCATRARAQSERNCLSRLERSRLSGATGSTGNLRNVSNIANVRNIGDIGVNSVGQMSLEVCSDVGDIDSDTERPPHPPLVRSRSSTLLQETSVTRTNRVGGGYRLRSQGAAHGMHGMHGTRGTHSMGQLEFKYDNEFVIKLNSMQMQYVSVMSRNALLMMVSMLMCVAMILFLLVYMCLFVGSDGYHFVLVLFAVCALNTFGNVCVNALHWPFSKNYYQCVCHKVESTLFGSVFTKAAMRDSAGAMINARDAREARDARKASVVTSQPVPQRVGSPKELMMRRVGSV